MASKEDRRIKPTDVTILCHSSGIEDHYMAKIRHCLESMGIHVTICPFGQSLPPSNAVISLLDIQEQSKVHRISQDDWSTLREYLLTHRATMLWLMPASQLGCEDPRSAMMLGLARTARNELALKILTVELDSAIMETTVTQAVAKILLRADVRVVQPTPLLLLLLSVLLSVLFVSCQTEPLLTIRDLYSGRARS